MQHLEGSGTPVL